MKNQSIRYQSRARQQAVFFDDGYHYDSHSNSLIQDSPAPADNLGRPSNRTLLFHAEEWNKGEWCVGMRGKTPFDFCGSKILARYSKFYIFCMDLLRSGL
jgi:hypothetical protein